MLVDVDSRTGCLDATTLDLGVAPAAVIVEFAAARPAAAASRPQSATMSGDSGRSKTRPAVRQAWEWARLP